MYCKTIIIGNLTKDVELKKLPSGSAIAKCSIAYTDGFGDNKKSHFIDIVCFSKTAEVLSNYCHKGSKVMMEGTIIFEQWTAQDGSARSKHSLRVDTMKMLDSKEQQLNNSSERNEPKHENRPPKVEQRVPEIDIDEDEIPF